MWGTVLGSRTPQGKPLAHRCPASISCAGFIANKYHCSTHPPSPSLVSIPYYRAWQYRFLQGVMGPQTTKKVACVIWWLSNLIPFKPLVVTVAAGLWCCMHFLLTNRLTKLTYYSTLQHLTSSQLPQLQCSTISWPYKNNLLPFVTQELFIQ